MKNFNASSARRVFTRFSSQALFIVLLAASFMTNLQAQVTVNTDATWRCFPLQPITVVSPPVYPSTNSFNNPPSGWTAIGYNDAAWANSLANGNNIWPTQPASPTNSTYIWAAGFRKTFTLTAANLTGFNSMVVTVNNGADIWINGNYVGNSNWIFRPQTFCIPSNFLVAGTNIIAVKAFEYGDFSTSLNISATFGQTPGVGITGNTNICAGSSTVLTATGGGTYKWSNGITTPSITATAAGTYTVTVTNAAGCTNTASATVSALPSPIAAITGNTSICTGSSTVLTATGGGTYKWSTGATTPSITTAAAGTYTVTVTSAAGCSATASTTVVIKPAPIVTITGNTSVCAGSSTILTATGGGTYSWSNGATTPSITVTPSMKNPIYSVTVTGANGCTATKSVTVSFLAAPVINLTSQCIRCDGTMSVVSLGISVSGGTAPYTYKWSNGATTKDLTNVVGTASSYCVTVTDAKGCTVTRCFECLSPCANNTGLIFIDPLPLIQNNTNNQNQEIQKTEVNQVSPNDSAKPAIPSEVKPKTETSVKSNFKTIIKVVGVAFASNYIFKKLFNPASTPKL